MAYKITDACLACGSCLDECPTESIKEGSPFFTIDPNTCIDCGACSEACPTGAIVEG